MNVLSGSRVTILIILLHAMLPAAASAQASAPRGDLTILVDDAGDVSIKLDIVPPQPETPAGGADAGCRGLFVVALPLPLQLTAGQRLPPNVRRLAGDEQHYTLLALLGAGPVALDLAKVGHIGGTSDGKGSLELDLTYQHATLEERQLLLLPNAIKTFDLKISLPQEYDPRDVSFGPHQLAATDRRTYGLPAAQAADAQVWISFPNPEQGADERATFFLTLMCSCLAVWVEFKTFQEQDIKWPLGVFFLGLATLLVAFYYGYTFRRATAFLALVAGATPQILYGVLASAHRLLAAKYQAVITGYVTIGGRPRHLGVVNLLRHVDGNVLPVRRTRAKKGAYTFYVWLRRRPQVYQVQVPASSNNEQAVSQPFQITTNEPYEVEPLDLKEKSILRPWS